MADPGSAPTTFGPDVRALDVDFQYYVPTPDQLGKLQNLRDVAYAFAAAILRECPPGPDRSVAYRLVREARMWANAAIVIPRGR